MKIICASVTFILSYHRYMHAIFILVAMLMMTIFHQSINDHSYYHFSITAVCQSAYKLHSSKAYPFKLENVAHTLYLQHKYFPE